MSSEDPSQRCRIRICAVIVVLLSPVLLFSAARHAVPSERLSLPVLCYHQIAAEAPDIMTTTPEIFEAQMKYLKESGYHTLTVEEAAGLMKGKGSTRGKPLLITFDDGYDGLYTYGLPILKKYGFQAVVFLVVGKITEKGTPHHLTWPQLKEMCGSGVYSAASHTHSMHVKIPEELESGRITALQVEKDLISSSRGIYRHLGIKTSAMAWPYGAYSEDTIRIAGKAGFSVLFTTDYGANHPGDGTLRIKRIRLSSSYDTVPRLQEKLSQYR